MKLSYTVYSLQFRHPFGVSSNTRRETSSVFIRLEDSGIYGYGEACLPAYLGETVEQTIAFFEAAKPLLEERSARHPFPEILETTDGLSTGCNAAKAAIDIALHDLYGKSAGKPAYDLMGIGKSRPQPTSFTIGIDTPEKLKQKIEEANEFSILKIKAGTADDKALIHSIRSHSDKPLYVDVNQGWKDAQQALDMLHWLRDQNVALVEQPMPVAMKKDMQWLTQKSLLPLIADESVKRLADLERLDGTFSGINIKLMKCTGMNEALKMIGYCRKNNLKIMLGCMAESSCATSAMAQLMQFADYIDLDAPQLYVNDPFTGVSYKNGCIHPAEGPGIGVEPVAGLIRF